MSTNEKRKSARKEATPEQKAAAIERKKNIREMFSKISALPIEKRVILAHQYGLRTAGAGHQLSASNTLLVMMQFPNASVVGGFEQWRKAGRVVKKGVKAIGIWVPVRGKESEAEGGDDTFFIIGNVFDISQTVDAATGADYDGSGWTAPAGEVMAPEAVAFPEGREVLQLGWTPDAPLALPAPVEVAPVAEYEAPEAVEVEEPEALELEVMTGPELIQPSLF